MIPKLFLSIQYGINNVTAELKTANKNLSPFIDHYNSLLLKLKMLFIMFIRNVLHVRINKIYLRKNLYSCI